MLRDREGNQMAFTRQNHRKAYEIRFRCTLTGCDWTARLFLHDQHEAFEAMYFRLAFGEGTGQGKFRYNRDFYRVVSCEVSADQARRPTPARRGSPRTWQASGEIPMSANRLALTRIRQQQLC
jgi:hypothetical protein